MRDSRRLVSPILEDNEREARSQRGCWTSGAQRCTNCRQRRADGGGDLLWGGQYRVLLCVFLVDGGRCSSREKQLDARNAEKCV